MLRVNYDEIRGRDRVLREFLSNHKHTLEAVISRECSKRGVDPKTIVAIRTNVSLNGKRVLENVLFHLTVEEGSLEKYNSLGMGILINKKWFLYVYVFYGSQEEIKLDI